MATNSEYVLCAFCPKNVIRLVDRLIRWERLSNGWLKLNTDEWVIVREPQACRWGGGVLRNEHGNWVIGFSRKIGIITSYLAELWALRDGLNICLSKNLLDVEVELDARLLLMR